MLLAYEIPKQSRIKYIAQSLSTICLPKQNTLAVTSWDPPGRGLDLLFEIPLWENWGGSSILPSHSWLLPESPASVILHWPRCQGLTRKEIGQLYLSTVSTNTCVHQAHVLHVMFRGNIISWKQQRIAMPVKFASSGTRLGAGWGLSLGCLSSASQVPGAPHCPGFKTQGLKEEPHQFDDRGRSAWGKLQWGEGVHSLKHGFNMIKES